MLTADQKLQLRADREAGLSRQALCEKYRLSLNALKSTFRRLGIPALTPEHLASALASAGRKSYEERVKRGTLKFGDINSLESVKKRAKTRRESEAQALGFSSVEDRYKKLASSKGGVVTGNFEGVYAPLEWTCSKGHVWKAAPKNMLTNGAWCPSCAHVGPSKGQLEVYEYIKSVVPDQEVILGDRQVIKPLELDIWVPGLRFGFEYNGLLHHSDYFGKTRGRHQKKALACRAADINLLAVYEDEWATKQDLIKAMIRWRLRAFNGTRLHARKLEMRRLEKNKEFQAFFERNHLDGHARARFAYGLFHEGHLVSCASFRTNHQGEFECARLATDYDYAVPGAAGRLFGEIKEPLISYSNNRLSSGAVYEKLGFRHVQDNPGASYWYTDGKERVWRFRAKRVNDPEVLARFPDVPHTETDQAAGGVFSEKIFGDRRPLYKIYDYSHRKWIREP